MDALRVGRTEQASPCSCRVEDADLFVGEDRYRIRTGLGGASGRRDDGYLLESGLEA